MAIIYSYPETLELLPADMLIGTSTIRVAGKKKNITKNFTLELLKNFILDGVTNVQWGTITGTLSNQTDLQAALNAKQNNITLTTTGSSGPATLVGATLNIPNYAGVSYTFTSPLINTAGVVTINQSSSTVDGYLSSTDWNTFNNKQSTITLTTTGTGVATLIANVLNIPTPAAATFASLTTTGSTGPATLIGGTLNVPDYSTGITVPTLNQVLTAGNTSIIDAKVGNLYSYDNVNADYGIVQFYDSGVTLKAATTNNILFYNDAAGTVSFSNGTYNPILNFAGVGNNIYTFQNANGTLAFTSDIPSLAGYVPTSRTLSINGTLYDLTADRSWSVGTVTSVALSMPSAFTVSNSPITGSGTIAVAGAGVASQYIRGDGTLANFPTSTGGGASVSYYLNGSVSQGTIGGVAYKEMNSVPVIGTGTDFTINADGYIAQFITDVGDPNKLLIPAGNWNFETYFSASSGGGSPRFYIELYKYDGATFTLIATNSATPEYITGGTSIDLYFTALAVPQTTLTITDRLAARFYVIHSGRTITMHTEDSHLSQIITTFSTGLTTLNGLTSQAQYFAVGTTGTDFNISSVTDTHTFNLPTASATNRGALSTTDWSTFNGKFNLPSLTSGSVLFSNGTTIAQDNANLFWDDTNNRLGIGTATPTHGLNVYTTVADTGILLDSNTNPSFIIKRGGVERLRLTATGAVGTINGLGNGLAFQTDSVERMRFSNAGNALINTTIDNGGKLQIKAPGALSTDIAFKVRNSVDTADLVTINGLGNVLVGTTTDVASSKLTVESTTQGFLTPRMTTTQRNAIATPATGLIVYDTTLLSEFQYNGTSWISNQPELNGTGFVKASGTTISYDNSVYNPIVINDFAGGSVTGTVANTIVASYLIPANTFKNKDAFSLTSYIYLSGAKSANQTLRFYFNSTVSLTGATLIATYTYPTAIRFGIFERMGTCTSEGNLLIWPTTFSTLSDRTTTASDYSLPAFPYTSNNYLIVAIQIGNISDFASLGLVRLTK